MIQVTEPYLPPYEEYEAYLKKIWERNWLTNNGPLVNELELQLKEYLGIKHLLYVANGTLALQLAIKALNLKGEIITTPFSYVATSSSIVWEGCKPVFVDIDRETFNINPDLIEEAITENTSAILATHVYGNPCDIDRIDEIAKKHHLKVIYDAAHCFGTKYKGKSIFAYGDISTTSFHATKLFHTIEGGAVFTNNPELLKKMAFMRNFGHNGPESFAELGINAKNSEVHAAMGLVNLKYIESILLRRKDLSIHYSNKLKNLKHERPKIQTDTEYNYSYFAIQLPNESLLLNVFERLNRSNIFSRRYFYPLLTALPYVDKKELPIAENVAKCVLCLPMYHQLSKEEIDFIARILLRVQNYES